MAGGERRLAVSVTWWRQVVWTNWDLGADQHIAIRYCQKKSSGNIAIEIQTMHLIVQRGAST